jgi:hypothetical protein
MPANAAAGYNPRLTFVAVLAALAQLAKQVDQAMVLHLLHQPLGTGVSGLQAVPAAVSQQPVVSVTSSHVQASDINVKAATLSASLQHMTDVDRCEVLARLFPEALCPEHAMLHPLKVCPLVTAAAAVEVAMQCNPW